MFEAAWRYVGEEVLDFGSPVDDEGKGEKGGGGEGEVGIGELPGVGRGRDGDHFEQRRNDGARFGKARRFGRFGGLGKSLLESRNEEGKERSASIRTTSFLSCFFAATSRLDSEFAGLPPDPRYVSISYPLSIQSRWPSPRGEGPLSFVDEKESSRARDIPSCASR